MTTSILGLGTASPVHSADQSDVRDMSEKLICGDDRERRLMQVLFNRSGVSRRHSCVPYQTAFDWRSQHGKAGPTTGERVRLYAEHSGPLARQAALQALDDAQIPADQVTHLVTVSCTGFDAPGVDIQLISSLGLRATTQRVHVGYMGCHGAINGLRVAAGLVAANPGACVLLCAVELCSLHYRLTWDTEGIKGNALFADGAAALVIGGADADAAHWSLVDTASCLIPDSQDEMAWKIGDHGFEMKLTGEVPRLIEEQLRPFLENWLGQHQLSVSDIAHWVIHPGGPRIIDAVQAAIALTDADTALSRSVLNDYGNMSSPTVLFILDRLRQQAANLRGPALMLGFGPGLMAEAALLHR